MMGKGGKQCSCGLVSQTTCRHGGTLQSGNCRYRKLVDTATLDKRTRLDKRVVVSDRRLACHSACQESRGATSPIWFSTRRTTGTFHNCVVGSLYFILF